MCTGPVTARWLTYTNLQPQQARVEQHLSRLSSPATPYPPPLFTSQLILFISFNYKTHTVTDLFKWLTARENSHVPSNSKKPSIVVMEAMVMTCQRKANTARSL